MPRGFRPELVALAGSMVKMRVTGLWANGPGRRRRVDRRLARGVEVHADDEIAALAHDPAGAGRRGAVDVHRHRREQAVGVVTDLRVEQARGHVEVDAAVHVEGLVGELRVAGRVEHRDQALDVQVEAERRLGRGGRVGDEAAAVEERDALEEVREGARRLRLGAIGGAVGEDGARGVSRRRVHEGAAGEVEARVRHRGEDHLVDDGVGRGRHNVDDGLTRIVEDTLADDRRSLGSSREGGVVGASQVGGARRERIPPAAGRRSSARTAPRRGRPSRRRW